MCWLNVPGCQTLCATSMAVAEPCNSLQEIRSVWGFENLHITHQDLTQSQSFSQTPLHLRLPGITLQSEDMTASIYTAVNVDSTDGQEESCEGCSPTHLVQGRLSINQMFP